MTQTFFPGHEDGDTKHVLSSDGTDRCIKCRVDLRGRADFSLSADNVVQKYRTLEQQLQASLAANPVYVQAEKAMQQSIAQKMSGLTDAQRAAARAQAQKALSMALFHTDPRVHAHLLMDPANDDPIVMQAALERTWRNDLNTWKSQAEHRAAQMVEIMDGLGKASLQRP